MMRTGSGSSASANRKRGSYGYQRGESGARAAKPVRTKGSGGRPRRSRPSDGGRPRGPRAGPRKSDDRFEVETIERTGAARSLDRVDPDLAHDARLRELSTDARELVVGEAAGLADRVGEPEAVRALLELQGERDGAGQIGGDHDRAMSAERCGRAAGPQRGCATALGAA